MYESYWWDHGLSYDTICRELFELVLDWWALPSLFPDSTTMKRLPANFLKSFVQYDTRGRVKFPRLQEWNAKKLIDEYEKKKHQLLQKTFFASFQDATSNRE